MAGTEDGVNRDREALTAAELASEESDDMQARAERDPIAKMQEAINEALERHAAATGDQYVRVCLVDGVTTWQGTENGHEWRALTEAEVAALPPAIRDAALKPWIDV
jgi:hypothetical protein